MFHFHSDVDHRLLHGAAYCCPLLVFVERLVYRPLPPVRWFPNGPGRASLRRVLWVRNHRASIGHLSTYPRGKLFAVSGIHSHSMFSVSFRCPSVPLRPASRSGKHSLSDEWSSGTSLNPASSLSGGSLAHTASAFDMLPPTPLVTFIGLLLAR
jgi:hypothetical protein